MKASPAITRRRFLAAGAGLVVGLAADGAVRAAVPGGPRTGGTATGLAHGAGSDDGVRPPVDAARFDAYVAIHPDGRVTIVTPSTEIGQGTYDSLPRLVAEELDADWSLVEVALPRADAALVNPVAKRQRVANSESVLGYHAKLRTVGATARALLVGAAAERLGVPAAELATERGQVIHAASGRRLGYGELAARAATRTPPADVPLKDPSRFTLVGSRAPRKDAPAKTTGAAVYAGDLRLPGLLTAALRMPPTLDGRLARFDAASVRGQPGVVAVAPVTGGVAVVADHFWHAKRAAERLEVEFAPGPLAALSRDGMRAELRAALERDAQALPFPDVDTQSKPPKFRPLDRAATLAALAAAPRRLECVYEVPYLAHLTMEPMSAVAWLDGGTCRVWAAHQQLDKTRELAAQLTGLPLERVEVNAVHGGGGFGRRWELDYVRQAIEVAKAVPGRPVRLQWTREQDTRHDYYRPAFVARTRIGLDATGIVAMHSRIAGQSVWRFQGKPLLPGMADPTVAALLIYDLYAFPNKYLDHVEVPWAVPVGLWRSVTLSQNAFFAESALDEAARALGRDPYRFRRALLGERARVVAVLDAAARAARWDEPAPRGVGRGIALSHGFDSLCAVVAEVEVKGREFAIRRLTAAFDCGRVVSPSGVEAQVEGGMLFGLSAALRGDLTIEGGAVADGNFGDQPILRLPETPRLDVVLVSSEHPPGGAGEAAVPPVAPALANAIHAAGGPRVRRLPLAGPESELRFVGVAGGRK